MPPREAEKAEEEDLRKAIIILLVLSAELQIGNREL